MFFSKVVFIWSKHLYKMELLNSMVPMVIWQQLIKKITI